MTTMTGSLVTVPIAAKPGHVASDGVVVVAPKGQEWTLGPKIIRHDINVDPAEDTIGRADGYQS